MALIPEGGEYVHCSGGPLFHSGNQSGDFIGFICAL